MKSISTKPNSSEENKTGSWRTQKPIIDFEKCIGCSRCAKICPEACIAMKNAKKDKNGKPIIDYSYCKGCGLCAAECPVKAIKMEKDF